VADGTADATAKSVVLGSDGQILAIYGSATSPENEPVSLVWASAATVPEPAAVALLGLGAGALLLRRRRN